MPRRNLVLAKNEIYHALNRSVDNHEILTTSSELKRAIEIIDYYRFPQKLRYSKFKVLPTLAKNACLLANSQKHPLVDIYTFALMPNHYHFLLKQLQDNGIRIFISNFQNSFAKYFNIKYDRHGSLFLNPFKAKWVETEEQFIHISRYIHLNPVTSYLIESKELLTYPWTSFPLYKQSLIRLRQNKQSLIRLRQNRNRAKNGLVNPDPILDIFKSFEKYLEFVNNQVDYQRRLDLIKKLTLE